MERLQDLYRIKQSYRKIGIYKPITKIVERAIEKYFSEAENDLKDLGGRLLDIDEID